MPLIPKKVKVAKHALSVQVDLEVFEDLQRYVKFHGADQGHVVNGALRYVFEKDKEFTQWKSEQSQPETLRKVS